MQSTVFSRVLDACAGLLLRRLAALLLREAEREERDGQRMRCLSCNAVAMVRAGSTEALAGVGFESNGLRDHAGARLWVCPGCNASVTWCWGCRASVAKGREVSHGWRANTVDARELWRCAECGPKGCDHDPHEVCECCTAVAS
jgi:hypothetical protein